MDEVNKWYRIFPSPVLYGKGAQKGDNLQRKSTILERNIWTIAATFDFQLKFHSFFEQLINALLKMNINQPKKSNYLSFFLGLAYTVRIKFLLK